MMRIPGSGPAGSRGPSSAEGGPELEGRAAAEATEAQTPPSSDAEPGVAGERGAASVNRVRSLQSRMSNVLAAGLMCSLGLGALVWYYAHVFARGANAVQIAQRAAVRQASGDAPLPPLGPFRRPSAATVVASGPPAPSLAEQLLGPAPVLPSPAATAAWNRAEELARIRGPREPAAYPAPARAGASALDRRLGGPVFAEVSGPGAGAGGGSAPVPSASNGPSGPPWAGPESPGARPAGIPDPMAALLRPSVTPAVEASVLPTQRFLLPKGAFIDCTLETAIDSTLPGMTTCVTATDAFSADGTVVLLERGTKLVGETRGQVRQGQARLFVLWTEARTPTGVIVPLNSPGTDALGRAGLTGKVDTHFWQRFGAAILVSVIDAGVQAGVQSTNNGGTVILNPSTSQDVMTGILRSTINIPPTVSVRQGARIQVLVARDVDFRSVYRLNMARFTPGGGSSP